MLRIAAVLVFAASLTACNVFNTLVDGWKHAKAVEADLETSIGMRPQVGFNWTNGRLTRVTVEFPRLYDAKPLRELAATVRRAVTNEFRQKADDIVLSFSLGASDAGTMAMAQGAH
jgi:hypothetical protein